MVTRIDLRVHTTAPSSRKDDERFKAQAEAYNSFAAASTRITIPNHASPARENSLPVPSRANIAPPEMIPDMQSVTDQHAYESPEVAYDPTTFLEETQLGYTALESQLFVPSSRTSKVHKQPTAPTKELEVASTRSHEPQVDRPDPDSSGLDPSSSSHGVPSQSSYLKSPILDRSNKKPQINKTNRQFFQSSKTLLPPFVPLQKNDGIAVGFIGQATNNREAALQGEEDPLDVGSNAVSGDDITSELPTSYSLSEGTSGSLGSKHHSVQRSVSDPGPSPLETVERGTNEYDSVQRAANSPSGGSKRIEEETAPQQEPARPNPPKLPNSETAVRDFASAVVILKDSTTDVPTVSIDLDLPTSIHAPPPNPSLQRFETHVTESLKYLTDNDKLAECYRPVFVGRDLEQFERGCWVISIASWPPQLRNGFFQFLAKMIESGRVGWGVWCAREPSSLEVRVFCWGETVRHIYLMLYVASKSKVRKLGLKWVDANDEVVVQMRDVDEVGQNS